MEERGDCCRSGPDPVSNVALRAVFGRSIAMAIDAERLQLISVQYAEARNSRGPEPVAEFATPEGSTACICRTTMGESRLGLQAENLADQYHHIR